MIPFETENMRCGFRINGSGKNFLTVVGNGFRWLSFKDNLGVLLEFFVKLNPPYISSSTKLRLNVKNSFWLFHRFKVFLVKPITKLFSGA